MPEFPERPTPQSHPQFEAYNGGLNAIVIEQVAETGTEAELQVAADVIARRIALERERTDSDEYLRSLRIGLSAVDAMHKREVSLCHPELLSVLMTATPDIQQYVARTAQDRVLHGYAQQMSDLHIKVLAQEGCFEELAEYAHISRYRQEVLWRLREANPPRAMYRFLREKMNLSPHEALHNTIPVHDHTDVSKNYEEYLAIINNEFAEEAELTTFERMRFYAHVLDAVRIEGSDNQELPSFGTIKKEVHKYVRELSYDELVKSMGEYHATEHVLDMHRSLLPHLTEDSATEIFIHLAKQEVLGDEDRLRSQFIGHFITTLPADEAYQRFTEVADTLPTWFGRSFMRSAIHDLLQRKAGQLDAATIIAKVQELNLDADTMCRIYTRGAEMASYDLNIRLSDESPYDNITHLFDTIDTYLSEALKERHFALRYQWSGLTLDIWLSETAAKYLDPEVLNKVAPRAQNFISDLIDRGIITPTKNLSIPHGPNDGPVEPQPSAANRIITIELPVDDVK